MRVLILLFVVFFGFGAASQQTEAPVMPELTVEIGPKAAVATNGYIHGQIVLKAQLLSRHPFEALELKLPQIPGADVIELQRPRTRKVTGYAGQGVVFETAIAIIPKTSGVLTIPPVTAIGSVEPTKDDELRFDLTSDPVELKIGGVSRHFENPWWLVSDRVEIEEKWSSPPEEIRVGEPVQRTLNVRVWGVAAERLPDIEHSRTRGVKVSLISQERRTEKSPDGLIGHATYTWDLVAEPQQVAFIAPIALAYWHSVEHRARKASVPALRLEPLPADNEKIAEALMREAASRRDQSWIIFGVIIGILLLPVIFFAGAFLATRFPTRADRRLHARLKGDPSTQNQYLALERWFSEAEVSSERFDQQHTSRRALSDHLFSREHPLPKSHKHLKSNIFQTSKAMRTARMLDWVRNL